MSFILDYLIQRGRLTWLRSCRRQRPVRLRKRGLMRGYFITKPGCYQMSSLLPPFCKQIDTCGTPGRGLHRDAHAGDDSRRLPCGTRIASVLSVAPFSITESTSHERSKHTT